MNLRYVKPERLSIRAHPELSEVWVQARIAEDPSILGLGELILKDKERLQPRAGRLDLLLQEPEAHRRFEVEVQLGRTDESHIIRTIEYWDLERKRYPQYDHTAVIVAEEITGRFLNVISLFNGFIPVVAIQMSAYRYDDTVSLVFTKVLDEMRLGPVDEDEDTQESTDRDYWEKRGSRKTVDLADSVLSIVHEWDSQHELKYNKFYIGLAKDGQPSNFVIFRPKKDWVTVEPRLPRSDDVQDRLDESGLDLMEYDSRWGRYRLRVTSKDLEKRREVLTWLLRLAYDEAQ